MPSLSDQSPEKNQTHAQSGASDQGLVQLQVPLDLAAIRRKLEDAKGPHYWRSLEEVAGTAEFQKFVDDEFPVRTVDWNDPINRRNLLKLMGASLALAGVSACTVQPKETIVPYVRQPEDFEPGKPLFYATAYSEGGVATGILVESHLGRPTKIEGNPDHPSSLGSTDSFTQSSVLTLYDPDRSQIVTHGGNISSWVNFVAALSTAHDVYGLRNGAGLRFLSEPVASPTLASQIKDLLAEMPQAKWHQYSPASRHMATAGSQLAFGQRLNSYYKLDSADVIVSLDADFLAGGSGCVRYAREFADKRRVDAGVGMSRLYAAEGTPSVTGAMADHRFRMRTAEVEAFAFALAAALGVAGVPAVSAPAGTDKMIPAVVKDLQAHKGTSLIVAGEYQPASVHALAHAMNQALGNTGKTIVYTDPLETNPVDQIASLRDLVNAMQGGQVETLIVIGGNPVYDAPADLKFGEALAKVKTKLRLGLYEDETSALCQWHAPMAHYLESWSDVRAMDGTVTIQQPLIAPLYSGKTAHQLLSAFAGKPDVADHDLVKAYWQTQHPAADFEDFWQKSLHDGIVAGTALAAKTPPAAKLPPAPAASAQGMEIVFRPDPSVGFGLYSNNGWLQELPKPQNKMTWDNAVWISPATAQQHGLNTGDVVEIKYRERTVRGPVWVLPGHAADSVTIHLGYGRTRAGRVANDIGFNAYALMVSDSPWVGAGVELRKVDSGFRFANTQHTQTMEERDPLRVGTLAEYQKVPDFAQVEKREGRAVTPQNSIFPPLYTYETGYKWGMTIDLNACVGCGACMSACQAENNIAVVGKAEVAKGRHMNWIRVDRYYTGSFDDPETFYQPVPCMQCEDAPCELVCPVAATVHSKEGLNEMVYNRCVGTRYCSNNCPYKVRRFNFFLYSDWNTESLYGVRNPDVTVRSRGVMEKCSYCIQRIEEHKITAEKENRRVKDGEIVTACQQACPTKAIVFGDMNDPNSQIVKMKASARNYNLLEDLGTRPRTTYLSRLRNPNPELEQEKG